MRQDAFKLVNPELNRSLIPRDSDVCVLTAMCRQVSRAFIQLKSDGRNRTQTTSSLDRLCDLYEMPWHDAMSAGKSD
eukprot:174736-Hanusia_phi.AAC.2